MRKIYFFFLLISFTAYTPASGQYQLRGKINLCSDVYPGASVPGRMTYKSYKENKKGAWINELDTLIVQIKVLNREGFFLESYSDKNGFYALELPYPGQYVMDLSIGYYFFSSYVIDVDSVNQLFNPCLSDSILEANFLTKIPYNRSRAEADIQAGNIRIISLNALYSGCKMDVLDAYHYEIIEKRYGFTFFWDFIEENIPENYLRQGEEAYNTPVYQYLDSLQGFDVREAIVWDLREMAKKVLLERYKKD